MEPVIPDLRRRPKGEAYAELLRLQALLLDGHEDPIAGMATTSALVHHAFDHLWTGFYRVVEPGRLLRVGPYQGTLGCLDIAFGRGVCGTAAAEGRTVVVPDVEAFPGHIACDGRAKSEIVVPVHDASGALVAVFDVDSAAPATFDAADEAGLEALMAWFARLPLPAAAGARTLSGP
jgi:GAF domain-containing protein